MKTKITEMLSIRYPIFQGAMAYIADAQLAAAASNAGGLGIIAAGSMNGEALSAEIAKTRTLTDKPFGVNLMLMNPELDSCVEAVLAQRPAVVTTGAGNPGPYMEAFKTAGIRVFPVTPGVALAKLVARMGADGVIAEGTESGGHIGAHATMSLVPQVVAAVNVPVVAAGGIATGEGLAAALCLGAEGVQCGTVFVASEECNVSQAFKDMLIRANDNATAVTGRSTGLAVRGLKNKLTRKLEEMEKAGASAEELEAFTVGSFKKAIYEGDTENGSFMAGQIAGLIREVRPVRAVIEDMVSVAEKVIQEKARLF